MKRFLHFLMLSPCLFLTGCQLNLFDRSLSPVSARDTFSKAVFQIAGWQVDTVYRGANYKGYLTYFLSESVGYLVCTNYPEVLKTADGGRTWTLQPSPMQVGMAYPTGVDFLDEQTGFITFQDTKSCPNNCQTLQSLIQTRDGGATWTLVQAAEKGILADPHFTSPNEGVATLMELTTTGQVIQSSRFLASTTNGGMSWQKLPEPTLTQTGNDVFYANRQVGFIRGRNQQLYRTLTSGRDWQPVEGSLPVGYQYEPVIFYDAQLGYTSAGANFYRTTDGGKSWQLLWQGSSNVVGFASPKEQFVARVSKVYDYGDYFEYEREIRQTSDGGQTWRNYPPVFRLDLPFVRFVSERVGYTVKNNMLLRFSRK